MIAIVVHGGAGWWRENPWLAEALAACREAAVAAQRVLLDGGAALDAVEAAVVVLEDAPVLNAGRGSYANTAGEVEMDAMIMDGATLGLGAVAAVQQELHPVSLARRVMADTRHTLLVGEGASRFADESGVPRVEASELLAAARARSTPAPADTVGAVALDRDGNLAVASSTGGIPKKMPGRVGDSPLVGCGAYADNETAAATATGDGEALMKLVISKHVCDAIGRGDTPQAACKAAVELLGRRLQAMGGLIALDQHGRIGVSFNAESMPYAFAVDDAEIVVSHEPI